MQPNLAEIPLVNNEPFRQFELVVNGMKAKIEYELQRNRMSLLHTEVPAALEGQGVGSAIVEKTLQYLQDHNLTLVPWCPFVKAYIRRHPEWKKILAQGIQV